MTTSVGRRHSAIGPRFSLGLCHGAANLRRLGSRQPAVGNRSAAAGSEQLPAVERSGAERRRSAFDVRRCLGCLFAPALLALPLAAVAQPLAAKDVQPYKSQPYNVAFSYPKKDWVAVPASGGNIALLMHRKGEASIALDFTMLRVPLAPDEIDETFRKIELEALTQRAPHARVASSTLTELGGHKVVLIKYGASGLTSDLDVTQYSIVTGASIYRLTCAATRATAARHASACETVAKTMVVGRS